MKIRTRTLIATAVVATAIFATAGSALADSASLSFLDGSGQNDPVADIGRTFTLSGTTAASERIYVKVRAPGGAACAPSARVDTGSYLESSASYSNYFDGETVNGDYTLRQADTWNGSPGTYMFCIWIASGDNSPVTPITQMVTFRAPTGTVSGAVNPAAVALGQDTTLTVSGVSEAPERVYATVRGAGGAPCAADADADSGTDLIDGTAVNGSFSIPATVSGRDRAAGTYVICIWVADSSSDTTPVAGPQPTSFTVVAPPPAPPVPPSCVVPQLVAGVSQSDAFTALVAANCTVGKRSYVASARYARGALIKTTPVGGTTLANKAAVAVLLSSGKPCRVPAVRAGMKLAAAESRIYAAGCTLGSVHQSRSRHRAGVVLRFTPGSGTRLSPRAKVGIYVSRGHH
jgi:hypothetical protein